MEASKCPIHSVFNGFRVLEIPFFQRSYVWKKPQWERFLEDMEFISKNAKPYFLGSIILKQQSTLTGSYERRTVIDGQQRLTTLAIFLKVLSLKLNQPSLIPMLSVNGSPALIHSHHDAASFISILQLTSEHELGEKDSVLAAYEFFKNELDASKVNPQRLFANIVFVVIDLLAEEDEQQIFDTINSLGVKLTTAELLKNYLFQKSEMHLFKKYWWEIFELDKKVKSYWDHSILAGRTKRSLIDIFFYAYLQIKIQDPSLSISTDDKDSFSKVEGLFASYKALFERYNVDKTKTLDEIRRYAEVFHASFRPGVIDKELEAGKIGRVNLIIFGLETTTLIPYVLYVMANAKEEDKDSLLSYIESYLMRRMVCHEDTRNYNQLFGDRLIYNQILDKKTLSTFLVSQSDQINRMPSDEDLRNGFHQSRLVNKQSSGILYLIESHIRKAPMHSTRLKGFVDYELEHLMPKKWRNHWTGPESESEKIKRDNKLMTMGNLSILPDKLNKSIRDGSWETKKKGNGKNDGLNVYASGLETIAQFLSEPDWNELTIDGRAEYLYQKALHTWPMN